MTTSTHIRKLIRESDLPITQIAKLSRVSYQTLWKWQKRKQRTLDLDTAERVYKYLTGRNFNV